MRFHPARMFPSSSSHRRLIGQTQASRSLGPITRRLWRREKKALSATGTKAHGSGRVRWIGLAAAAVVLIAGVLLFWAHSSAVNRPIKTFWAPFLSSDRVIIVLGDEGDITEQASLQAGQPEPSVLDAVNSDRVGFADSQAAARAAALPRLDGQDI